MKPTNEQIEQYRKIVADVPHGSVTHIDIDGDYLWFDKDKGVVISFENNEYRLMTVTLSQSLDNLRTIIALWDENQALREALEDCAVASTKEEACRIADRLLGGGV